MSLALRQTFAKLLRFTSQQLLLLAFVFVSVASFSTSTHAALNTTVTSTAKLTYTGYPSFVPASVDVLFSVTTANTGTVAVTAPANVAVGGTAPISFAATNTGINTLTVASMVVVPPAGTTYSIPVDLNGLYTAVVQPDNSWVITIPDLLPGASFAVAATLNVPVTATPGSVPIDVTLNANAIIGLASATTNINIQNNRTRASIRFMKFDAVNNVYVPVDPYTGAYHAGEMIYIEVRDLDQNIDGAALDTVTIDIEDIATAATAPQDSYAGLVLTETGNNTGVFIGSIPSSLGTVGVANDNIMVLSIDSKIVATYQDPLDIVFGPNSVVSTSTVLVDPFGLFFDSRAGLPIDGATVTVIDTVTGQPAMVFGDDQVSTYPSTIISGGSTTDSSGKVYNFAPGKYRFPFMNLGNYRLQVVPPTGYNFPTQVSDADINAMAAATATGPFTLAVGSRGEQFTIQAGPALHIDVPLDSKGTGLFIQKTALTTSAAVGDIVRYQLSIENVDPLQDSYSTVVTDTLPLGLRYQAGSTIIDGVKAADPAIGADGRTLSFSLATLASNNTVAKVTYATVVGANAKLGAAVNTAYATGTIAGAIVRSNTARASVKISEDLIRSRGFIAGVVFVDANMNELQDDGELGVAGIRIFMEDGRSVVTDKDGRYHFDGIKLGTHVVQMDKISIAKRYQAVGLTQNRFSNNDFSQFADVNAGGLVRANFRVVERAPEKTPVKVKHVLTEEANKVWADVEISHGEAVKISELTGFYILPQGWKYIQGTSFVNGKAQEPEKTPAGLAWRLDASKVENHIRLAMHGGGEGGLKQAVAYARFTSAGTDKGRTGLAKLNIQDKLEELKDQRSFTLNVKFGNRKAELDAKELEKLSDLLATLDGMVIRDLIIEGHTDSIPIAVRHRDEFANNTVLSQARADFIANYFKEQLQLDESIVHAIGKGESEPIASNRTAKGRKANRRVVLKVRADKITYDFSTALKDKLTDAYGEALGTWDEEEVVVESVQQEKEVGILSPTIAANLPDSINSVRIALDSKLKPALMVDGESVSNDNIGFKSVDPKTGKTIYTFIGVDFGKPGEHILALKGLDPFGNARFNEEMTVIRTGKVARIKLIETAANVADGKTPVRFKLEIKDDRGAVISGSLKLQQFGGDLTVHRVANQTSVALEASQYIDVAHDGWVELAPVASSGTHRIIVGYNNIQETIELYVKPEVRDWILVGFAEGTLGYNKLSGAVQPVTKADEADKFYQDGRVAFYAKGKVSGDFLLTMAYDTAAKSPEDKNSRYGDIDPNSMYTIYGDTTQQQFEAASSKKLYVKIERDTFYALFGDYNTGLTTTELTRYSRVFTGVKAEMHEDNIGFTAFATQTNQTMVRDDIRGNGTSGLYHLSRNNLITNSEKIRIETVDRFKSEVILSSIELTRHVDYDIDYLLGTIWFKQPVLSKDAQLNPIYIRVEYESNDQADEFTTAGGRIYVKPTDNIEVGATFVSEGTLAGSNSLSGADAKIELSDHVEVRAEAASSTNNNVNATAWKVEARLADEKLSGKAYVRQQDDNFGLGQQQGSENATFKVGADAQYRLNDEAKVNGEVFRQKVTSTSATRDMANVQYNQRVGSFDLRGGVRANRDTDGAGNVTGSTLGSVGATTKLSKRLTVRADHEEALSNNNGIDFPSRTSLGADYAVTAATKLTLTQEWTRGQAQNTSSTRIGASTEPWNGARASLSYEEQLGDNGQRSFANAGLLQTWQLSQALSFSASIDQTKVLSGATPPQLNINAPAVTGGEGFTAYSLGSSYKPGSWVWTNRLEYRTSTLSKHQGASMGLQGSISDDLAAQFVLRWQKDVLASDALTLAADASLRAAWRTSYDQLILLNRFDVRSNETSSGLVTDAKSLRYINNLTANWQAYDAWQLRFNHGIKLSDETATAATWKGLTDLAGLYIIYDFAKDWDLTMQATALRVRHLHNYQSSAGMAIGYNMFDNFWLSFGYNTVGFYDKDFTAAEYTREGMYMRFRFKFDQNSLENMLK